MRRCVAPASTPRPWSARAGAPHQPMRTARVTPRPSTAVRPSQRSDPSPCVARIASSTATVHGRPRPIDCPLSAIPLRIVQSRSLDSLPCWPGRYRAVTADLMEAMPASLLQLPCWPGEYRAVTWGSMPPATETKCGLACWPGEYRAVTNSPRFERFLSSALPCWPGEYRAVTPSPTSCRRTSTRFHAGPANTGP